MSSGAVLYIAHSLVLMKCGKLESKPLTVQVSRHLAAPFVLATQVEDVCRVRGNTANCTTTLTLQGEGPCSVLL